MAKIKFTSPVATAYRQVVILARRRLQDVFNMSLIRGTVAAPVAVELFNQVRDVSKALGGTSIINGQSVPMPVPTGTRVTGYTFTIVNGVITAAVGY